MSEKVRGCGYRKVGGLYLVGDGKLGRCDGLPLKLEGCGCCGYLPPFTRTIQKMNWNYLAWLTKCHHPEHVCICDLKVLCPVCNPTSDKQYAMMWVGEKFYKPHEFIAEARAQGISKRINELPKDVKPFLTWIILAHRKVPFKNGHNGFKESELEPEPETFPAIFYAFKPERVEFLLWKQDADAETIKFLEDKGLTPILIDRNDPKNEVHRGKKGYPDWFKAFKTSAHNQILLDETMKEGGKHGKK